MSSSLSCLFRDGTRREKRQRDQERLIVFVAPDHLDTVCCYTWVAIYQSIHNVPSGPLSLSLPLLHTYTHTVCPYTAAFGVLCSTRGWQLSGGGVKLLAAFGPCEVWESSASTRTVCKCHLHSIQTPTPIFRTALFPLRALTEKANSDIKPIKFHVPCVYDGPHKMTWRTRFGLRASGLTRSTWCRFTVVSSVIEDEQNQDS